MDRELSDRLAELEERLKTMESSDSLRDRGRGVMDRIVPPEARSHFRRSGRDGLVGMRMIIDSWIRGLDEKEDPAPQQGTRERIDIE